MEGSKDEGQSNAEMATQKRKLPHFVPWGAPPGISRSELKHPGSLIRILRPSRKEAVILSV